jgi:hypothetical protein
LVDVYLIDARGGGGAGLVLGCCFLGYRAVYFWLIFLALLATVRGGTSFLGPSATKKRSKENASPPLILKCPERARLTVWYFRRTLDAGLKNT